MFSAAKIARTLLAPMILLSAMMSGLVLANDTYQQAWDKIAQGAMIVDVRTPGEFAQGHLPNAINVPYQHISEAFAANNIAKDAPVVVYCRSGNRSGKAQQMLMRDGYTNVFNGMGYQGLMATQPAN